MQDHPESMVATNRRSKFMENNSGPSTLQDKVAKDDYGSFFGLEVDAGQGGFFNSRQRQQSGIYGMRASENARALRRGFNSSQSRSASRASSKKPQSRSSSGTLKNPHRGCTSRSRLNSRLKRAPESSLLGSRAVLRSSAGHSVSKAAVHIVCAIAENLGRETCVASLDAGTPVSLQVTKQANGQTYAETLAYLAMLRPDEVILNEGRRHSPLAKKIIQFYEGESNPTQQPEQSEHNYRNGNIDIGTASLCETQTAVKFISRAYFDQTKGAVLLRRLAREETYDATLVEEYIFLSASFAVLHYTQHSLGTTFSRNCLDVVVNSGGKNRMTIDRSTLLQLEILTNARTGKTKNSLVSTIDCTKTSVGSRLLRTNLMAPPCRTDTINARLDLVDSFLGDEDFFYAVLEHLEALPAIDKMLSNIALIPRTKMMVKDNGTEAPFVTEKLASKGISALVYVKTTLTAVPALANLLRTHLEKLETQNKQAPRHRDSTDDDTVSALTARTSLLIGLGGGPTTMESPEKHHLIRAIVQAISHPDLSKVLEVISDVFTESTKYSRNTNAMRHQECFALKSRDNGMIDVLRKAFLANVDDIHKKADEYGEVNGFHVNVKFSASRGYYLSVPADVAAELPESFIHPTKHGRQVHCTTEEIISLSTRARDNVHDLLVMTYEQIQDVLEEARSKYDSLASLSDAIALLDLCHSFADQVTRCKLPWSRPVVRGDSSEPSETATTSKQEGRSMIIRNGRYAIETAQAIAAIADGPDEVIPNDTYATGEKRFTVISGINGSGKSTYLRQIATIVLLSHCGSYVPAEEAYIPIRTRICARMGTADDQENNISSFMLEMKETAFICNNASEKSLVLLDELGRATSNEDGVAIAWAVAEFLLKKQAMTFFVTHYPQLCEMSKVYPCVQNQHLSAAVSRGDKGGILYSHKVTPGPCNVAPDYGVQMAASCGWSGEVVEEACQIETRLQEKLQQRRLCGSSSVDPRAMRMVKELSKEMIRLVQSETSLESLRSSLHGIRARISEEDFGRMSAILDYMVLRQVDPHSPRDRSTPDTRDVASKRHEPNKQSSSSERKSAPSASQRSGLNELSKAGNAMDETPNPAVNKSKENRIEESRERVENESPHNTITRRDYLDNECSKKDNGKIAPKLAAAENLSKLKPHASASKKSKSFHLVSSKKGLSKVDTTKARSSVQNKIVGGTQKHQPSPSKQRQSFILYAGQDHFTTTTGPVASGTKPSKKREKARISARRATPGLSQESELCRIQKSKTAPKWPDVSEDEHESDNGVSDTHRMVSSKKSEMTKPRGAFEGRDNSKFAEISQETKRKADPAVSASQRSEFRRRISTLGDFTVRRHSTFNASGPASAPGRNKRKPVD